MVRTKRGFILATCVLSGLGAILNLVALGTQQWVVSDGEFTLDQSVNDGPSYINYGLFSGVLEQNFGGTTVYELQMTCLFAENVCAVLCGTTQDARVEELRKLYNGENVTFDSSCPNVPRMYSIRWHVPLTRNIRSTNNREFLNAGVWLSSLIFLILAALFGLVSAGIAVWNTATNPIEIYFNIFGLYIYNSVASISSLLVVVLWGSLFGTVIRDNVGILYTILGQMDTSGWANLGYSYWLNLVSFLLYATSVGLLFIRQYLVNHQPVIKDIQIDDRNDPNIYLY